MTKERLVKPIVHQHLDTIEDQIVVDAIATKMGKYHDTNGPMYDHETGRSDHHAMRCIAEACANVYEEGMDHELVWQSAQEQCTDAAIGLGWSYMREVKEQGSGSETTRKEILLNVSAALYMFALDSQMGIAPSAADADRFTTVDALFDTDLPSIVRDTITSQIRYMREHGIVADDGEHEAVAVAHVIAERPRKLRHEAWRSNMEAAYDELTDEEDTYTQYRRRVATELTRRALDALTCEDDPDALREPCERTLEFVDTHYIDDGYDDNDDMAITVLQSLPAAYVAGLYKQGGEAAQRFESLLQRVYDSGFDIDGHTLWKLHTYLPGGLTGDIAAHHPVIAKLRAQYRDDSSFLAAALPEMPSLRYPDATPAFNQHMRDMMTDICTSLFPDPDFARRYAQDLARSFEPRLFAKDESTGYAAYENSDGQKTMQVIINRLLQRVRKHGAERFMKIADRFDLGAIDVLSPRDLEVLDALESGDQNEIAAMKQQDVTLVMFDAYGDHNGAMTHIANQLNLRDAHHERILMPWRHLPDFHETLAMLRRYGIKPSTIVVANHGDPGIMSFNKGPESFQIVSDMSVARPELGVHHPYDMSYSQMATVTRHFMSEPRHATGGRGQRKRIVLASCASDSGPNEITPSVAEMGIRMINQADVSVIATEDYATVFGNETSRGLYMAGNRTGKDHQDPRTSNMIELSIDPTSTWIDIERREVESRIT